MKTFQVRLFRGSQLVFQANNVWSISLRLVTTGQITVLSDHVPLIGEIQPGSISFQTTQTPQIFSVGAGVFYFANNCAKIIVQTATK